MEKIKLELISEEYRDIVLGMLNYLREHSEETYIHSIDVAKKSFEIASALNISNYDLKILYTASLLHDIGKLCVDNNLLHKKNASQDEINKIRTGHIEGTAAILSDFFPGDIVRLASHHHERLNSSGYPEHLNAEKLNLLDRILQVADVTSALQMNRSYKSSFNSEQITKILDNLVSQGELDPKCVEEIEKIVLAPINDNQPQ